MVLGVSLPLSFLNVYFRDIQYIWTIVIHAGFFVMPILYSYEIFPEPLKSYLSLIPPVKLLLMAQDVTIYGIYPEIFDWIYLTGISFAILIIGYFISVKLNGRLIEHF